jgi:hypothetical protein
MTWRKTLKTFVWISSKNSISGPIIQDYGSARNMYGSGTLHFNMIAFFVVFFLTMGPPGGV